MRDQGMPPGCSLTDASANIGFCTVDVRSRFMPSSKSPTNKGERPAGRDREWSPRFWSGMNARGWFRLLWRNRLAVDLRFWPHVITITGLSLFHTVWRAWQWLLVGRRARKTEIHQEPVFIVGHWRSGTTLLHELMVLDDRHTSPTTYECLAPNHFLLTEDFACRWLGFLLPAHRPMDNMPAGWDRPQEDEFALCNLGTPSPYLTIAFPNHPPQDQEYLTLRDLPPKERDRWKRSLLSFLRQITYRTPKRIILKSPPHTARVRALLELFPDARFVHIVRNPYVVFASTVHLWKKLYLRHGLQNPTYEGLEEHVLQTFERMYQAFEEDRTKIAPNRYCEVRYEELARDPVSCMRSVYEKLDLGEFETALPALEQYVAGTRGYQTNKYELTPEMREQVCRRWADFIHAYGYETEATSPSR